MMVTDMRKRLFQLFIPLLALLPAAVQAEPSSRLLLSLNACGLQTASPAPVSCERPAPGEWLHLVRDTRAAASGGGGGRTNGCWSACFIDYSLCMDQGPKNVCVSRMKTCLAICDHLTNRPDM
jgi:hypothetical protein